MCTATVLIQICRIRKKRSCHVAAPHTLSLLQDILGGSRCPVDRHTFPAADPDYSYCTRHFCLLIVVVVVFVVVLVVVVVVIVCRMLQDILSGFRRPSN